MRNLLLVAFFLSLLLIAGCTKPMTNNSPPPLESPVHQTTQVLQSTPTTQSVRLLTEVEVLEIANQCSQAIRIPDPHASPFFSVRGKVILVSRDPITKELKNEQFSVPEYLKARNIDKKLTVFIAEKEYVNTSIYYTSSKNKDYKSYYQRVDSKIFAIYWPENKLAGVVHLRGEDAPHSMYAMNVYDSRPTIGGDGIKEWIHELPNERIRPEF